nr:MAG TPA: hypothetical protein [Bacteriophage sp.]
MRRIIQQHTPYLRIAYSYCAVCEILDLAARFKHTTLEIPSKRSPYSFFISCASCANKGHVNFLYGRCDNCDLCADRRVLCDYSSYFLQGLFTRLLRIRIGDDDFDRSTPLPKWQNLYRAHTAHRCCPLNVVENIPARCGLSHGKQQPLAQVIVSLLIIAAVRCILVCHCGNTIDRNGNLDDALFLYIAGRTYGQCTCFYLRRSTIRKHGLIICGKLYTAFRRKQTTFGNDGPCRPCDRQYDCRCDGRTSGKSCQFVRKIIEILPPACLWKCRFDQEVHFRICLFKFLRVGGECIKRKCPLYCACLCLLFLIVKCLQTFQYGKSRFCFKHLLHLDSHGCIAVNRGQIQQHYNAFLRSFNTQICYICDVRIHEKPLFNVLEKFASTPSVIRPRADELLQFNPVIIEIGKITVTFTLERMPCPHLYCLILRNNLVRAICLIEESVSLKIPRKFVKNRERVLCAPRSACHKRICHINSHPIASASSRQ